MIANVAALVSFQEGSQLLEELAGVKVDAKQVERTAEALGAEIAADEKQDLNPLVFPNGLPETATTELDLPEVSGAPLTGDDAASDAPAPLVWDRGAGPLRARQPALFRFRVDPPDGLEPYMGMAGHARFSSSLIAACSPTSIRRAPSP